MIIKEKRVNRKDDFGPIKVPCEVPMKQCFSYLIYYFKRSYFSLFYDHVSSVS